jgi:hypothetical protein
LIFPIHRYRSPTPIVSLGGNWFRSKPIIPFTIFGPTGQLVDDVLVDSGSDDVVFPVWMAAALGVSLIGAPQRHAGGVGAAQPVGLLFAPVILELTDQVEVHRWRATVAFAQTKMRFPLLGIAGGLEHFVTTFNFSTSKLVMIAQLTLPATQDSQP